VVAVPIGIISAIRQYSSFDITVTTLSFAGQAIPEFFLGLVLILIFYAWLKNPATGGPLLPPGGMSSLDIDGFSLSDRFMHLILPVATGALGWIAWYSRFLRSSMLDVIHQDYLRTARAKGLPNWMVLYKHALRNALIPLITMLAIDLPYLFGGAVFVETIFSWPGMGRLYFTAAVDRDYPVLLAILILGAAAIILSNLLADLAYSLLDPRVRYN
jgi:peptide/nickel transport system permease protein